MAPLPKHPVLLSSRGILRVAGADALHFLQGLVTIDVHRLCATPKTGGTPALFGAFLNRRGRVCHTAFLVRNALTSEVYLDTSATSAPILRDHLLHHRLRARVDVENVSNTLSVIASETASSPDYFTDPRHPLLGARAIIPTSNAPPANPSAERDTELWRVLCGIPDSSDVLEEPLPLNLGLHELNAIDFDKGCYLGQELTARTHFTGVLRKRLTPVAIGDEREVRAMLAHGVSPHALWESAKGNDAEIEQGVLIRRMDGKIAGKISSATGRFGLAVLKLQDAFGEDGRGIAFCLDDGRSAVPWRPLWWGDSAEENASD